MNSQVALGLLEQAGLVNRHPDVPRTIAMQWNIGPGADQVPDGTIIGARGPNGPFAPPTALNKWFAKAYKDKFGITAVYASYHMATAFLGVKAAYEKAQAAAKGREPGLDDVVQAFEYLKFESPSGSVIALTASSGVNPAKRTASGVRSA